MPADAMKLRQAADTVKHLLDNLFVWTRDRDRFDRDEDWRSHIEALRLAEPIRDDCDGYMMTAADALLAAGVPADAVRYVICTTEAGEGHAVCAVDIEGDTVVLDNRQRQVLSWDRLRRAGYTFQKSMRLSERGVWRSIPS